MRWPTFPFAHNRAVAQFEATRLLNIRILSDITRTVILSRRVIAESHELLAKVERQFRRDSV